MINLSKGATSVASMITNLVIINAHQTKEKKM